MPQIKKCEEEDTEAILEIINAAAGAYRGVIPAEHWHEPYMAASQLEREIAAGVVFHGETIDGKLVGVMGIQPRDGVDLIRHAYVLPRQQGRGIGRRLLSYLRRRSRRPLLIGTWAAAGWAIGFYESQGFVVMKPEATLRLLRTHWDVSEEQMAVSVVLAEAAHEQV